MKRLDGAEVVISLPASSPVRDIFNKSDEIGWSFQGNARLIFDGVQLTDRNQTLAARGITNDSEIHFVMALRKPAIYILSPASLDNVHLSVRLSEEWEFTTVYPLAASKQPPQHMSWDVSVKPDGTLKDLNNGAEVSYLFWEASAVPVGEPAADAAPGKPGFNPTSPLETSGHHTVLTLPFETFIPYLDSTLKGLLLTPAMRTEFIAYWLPSFQQIRDRNENIGFTFVHQDAFTEAARITVKVDANDGDTAPHVIGTIARVFMLFGGIPADETWQCSSAAVLATTNWPGITGVDLHGLADETSLRILEWGGTEVTTLWDSLKSLQNGV